MVFEKLIGLKDAEKNPWKLMILGFIYTTIAIFLSLWIFKSHSSLIMIFLAVFATIPLIYKAINNEETKDLELGDETKILKQHSKVLRFLMFLFFGMMVGFTFWYVVLPTNLTSILFNVQTDTIFKINGNVTTFGDFSKIIFNNLKVLIFCIMFSFFYGVGAIFILTWNASVIGTAIGSFIKSQLITLSTLTGFDKIGHYFGIISLGLLQYSIHGIPEILAYFVGGLAGGIISFAIIKHDFRTKNFKKIILDTSDLIVIAIFLIIIAAALEVFVTPVIFG